LVVTDTDVEWRTIEVEVPVSAEGVGDIEFRFNNDKYAGRDGSRGVILGDVALDGHVLGFADSNYTQGFIYDPPREMEGSDFDDDVEAVAMLDQGTLTIDTAPFFERAFVPGEAPEPDAFVVFENEDGAAIAAVAAEDPEGGALTYEVSDARFEIVDGQVRLRDGESLDHEAEPEVVLEIAAVDGDGLRAAQTITVEVLDANEHDVGPVRDEDPADAQVPHGADVGDAVGLTLAAEDLDGDAVTFTVDDPRFEVDENGVVRVAEGAEFRPDEPVELTATATSADGSTSTASYTIPVQAPPPRTLTLTDEDEAADGVSEAAQAGDLAGVTVGVDDLNPWETADFSVSDARFEVDETGVVRVAEGATFDHETDDVVQVEVTATLDDGSVGTRLVDIAVADVNEAPEGLEVTPIQPRHFGDSATLTVQLAGEAYQGDPEYIIRVDGVEVAAGAVDWSRDTEAEGRHPSHDGGDSDLSDLEWRAIEIEVPLPPGGFGEVSIQFPNDRYKAGYADRNLHVGEVAVDGHPVGFADADYGHRHVDEDGDVVSMMWKGTLEIDAEPFFDGALIGGDAPAPEDFVVLEGQDGAAIAAVAAEDPEGGALTYEVSDARFEVVDGQVRLREGESLVHEDEPTVPLQITVEDDQGRRITHDLTLEVRDVDAHDVGEIEDRDAADAVVALDAEPGDAIGITLFADDPDTGETVSYAVDDARFEVRDDGAVVIAPDAVFTPGDTVSVTATATSSDGSTSTKSFDIAVESPPAPADPEPLLSFTAFGAPGETVDNEAGDDHDGVVQDDGWTLVEDASAFDIDAGALSVVFNADDVQTTQGLFSRDSSGYDGGGHLTVTLDDGDIVVRLQSTDGNTYLRAPVEAGETTSAVIAFGPGAEGEADGLKLYVNGELVDSDAYSGGIGGNDEPIVVGASQGGSGNGVADKVREIYQGEIVKLELYDQPLTADQIQTLADGDLAAAAEPEPAPAPEPEPAPAPADPEPLLSFTAFGAPGETVENEAGDDQDGVVQDDGWTLVEDASAFDIDAGALSVVFNADDVNANQGL
ncbi:MAG: carbohydrate-binding domain-containing protein, partial [Pseudomonadota bacterium]